jgi:hypothetical protein
MRAGARACGKGGEIWGGDRVLAKASSKASGRESDRGRYKKIKNRESDVMR